LLDYFKMAASDLIRVRVQILIHIYIPTGIKREFYEAR
jgi:hypothetical protein